MDDRDDLDFGAFLFGILLGGIVGAALGLLFAPQSGEETREMIRDKGIEIRDKVEESATAARVQAEAMARDAKMKAEELQKKGQAALESQKARLEQAIDSGKKASGGKRVELDSGSS
jgi:gas vesicle protein